MPISPLYAFETCWEVYQRIQEESNAIALLKTDSAGGCGSGGWRPVGLEAKDYAADFVLAGKAALQPGHRAGHALFHLESLKVLFEMYYVSLCSYEHTRRWLTLSERTWTDWTDEIRDKVGKELMRRGLFPPRNYFGERTRPRRKPAYAQPAAPSETQATL